MPKETLEDGESLIVFAVMRSNGQRVEFSGKVTNDCAGKMLAMAIEKPLGLNLTTPNAEVKGGRDEQN